ncbi:MAG: phage tail protein [Candidatus Fluviicola riflensis]|nr:MAG: phage tail protein [Candidatus Fluviicola riflensis]OGS79108.1 MAG: phage tail protein [Candidatus Fluviicola riflensis]OGS86540.1 MAG: phage tail protein [Fluviicola sp. RIFCSPHIGHO2_01_FULL_43_53]OGS88985.1 MAG: phage tail protein [Fluviicola sp. RIFCSPHIGHO2_12_FULL_43_24]
MSTEPFVGEVKLLGFQFPPLGYSLCQGQTMSIAEYTALFALIGTTYGGNGTTTFNLPDLQGRVPIGQGQGPGLPDYTIGEEAGSPTVTLTSANLPAHIHTVNSMRVALKVNNAIADSGTPLEGYPGTSGTNVWAESATTGATMAADGAVVSGSTDITGSNMPVSITNPYLVLNYSIAIEGIFPSRN